MCEVRWIQLIEEEEEVETVQYRLVKAFLWVVGSLGPNFLCCLG